MNTINFIKKWKIKYTINKLNKFGIKHNKELMFSPQLLWLDLFEESNCFQINKDVLEKIVFQISTHLNLQTNFSLDIKIDNSKDCGDSKSQEILPINIKNDTIHIFLIHSNCFFNIGEQAFIALLCRELTRYYLENMKFKIKSDYQIEIAMCWLGICKEAHLLLDGVITCYYIDGKIKKNNLFACNYNELLFAREICLANLCDI